MENDEMALIFSHMHRAVHSLLGLWGSIALREYCPKQSYYIVNRKLAYLRFRPPIFFHFYLFLSA